MGEDARVIRTRADVARTALDLLTREGPDALTHARIAGIARYSKTTLYAHWPSRADLFAAALEALGDMPHHEPTGDLHADLVGELKAFRQAVVDLRLDRVIFGLAQWSTVEAMEQVRDRVNTEGQRPIRAILERAFDGPDLEAAISMLSGVVACPSLMFGALPDDDIIEAAVGIVLKGVDVAGPPSGGSGRG
ncbi:TetR/AcrR family transcriptional regulator [Mycobacterium sp. NBC_00419]|uniref:TetR/AcrR family transcriptional regulator n=1 Tax=Mycobacterium sp. NBC_00419 TaxID=2975989 RepID=UPI002E1D5A8B